MNKETCKLIERIEDYLENGLADTFTKEDNIDSKEAYPTRPNGDFIAMIEYFSGGINPEDNPDYKGWFSEHELSGTYIRDAMVDIIKTQHLSNEVQTIFGDKVSVVFLDFNQSCEYGCAINVWVKKQ